MSTIVLVLIFTAGNATMAIQKPFKNMQDCRQGGASFLQQYESEGMGPWELQYVDCVKNTAI